ncbi:MAG: hypothetical protein BZY75_03770 [SAR202 cluster bacterium Io17-Chloro-G7]|nr:MAG: hypothetical protein BZY75_03770 [SAR202 cluster bacterium Io17-Chloro-G7]
MTTSHESQHDSRHPSFKQYVLVAVILFTVTIVEFLLIWDRVGIVDDLGASKIPLLIILSAFKFAIVIMFYMHLKFEARLLTYIFLAGLALAFIVGIALLGIFFAYEGNPRDFAESNAVAYEHEAEGGEAHSEVEAVGGGDITLSVVGDALKFDTAELHASAGSDIKITFNNVSTVNQHNLVLVEAGTKDEVATAGIGAGADNDWVPPDDPRVLFNTKLLDPGESTVLEFTLEAGTYTFVCTFPGHNIGMFGDFTVSP